MNRPGIVCALKSEARCFTTGELPPQQPVEPGANALLIVSGMGRQRARQAAQQLIDAGADCLTLFGVAGALAPTLEPGALVVPEQALAEEEKYAVNATLPASFRERLTATGIRIHAGSVLCVAHPVASVADKRALHARTGALAVDMESAGVLEAARDYGLPALLLRVIIDAAHIALPDAVLRRVDVFGEVDATGLALRLAKSPAEIPAVLRLASASRRATRVMQQVAAALLQHFGE